MNENSLITAKKIQSTEFRLTKLSEGYETNEVDDILDSIIEALEVYEHILTDFEKTRDSISKENFIKVMDFLDSIRTDYIDSFSVINARFTPTKFRMGYHMEDVDDFLDECIETLRSYELRSNKEHLKIFLNSKIE